MIRVNLNATISASGLSQEPTLPIEGVDGFVAISDKEIQRQGATRLLMIIIFPAMLYVYELQTIPALQTAVSQKQNYLNELTRKNDSAKTAREEFKKFEAEQVKIQSQIGIIENLKKNRMQEVKVLDSIQRMIPSKVWLNRVELNTGKVQVEGHATTNVGITSFMDSLSRSVFLREVNLVRTEEDQNEIKGMPLTKFEIACILEKVQ